MRRDGDTRPHIPCRFCGEDTPMLGTQTCDNCYEVACRVGRMPWEVILRILLKEKSP